LPILDNTLSAEEMQSTSLHPDLKAFRPFIHSFIHSLFKFHSLFVYCVTNKRGPAVTAATGAIRWVAAFVKLDVGRDERLAWLSHGKIDSCNNL